MIDIEQFCTIDKDYRPELHKPWTLGEWTYATDGVIAVRAPARHGYAQAGRFRIPEQLKEFFEKTITQEPPTAAPEYQKPVRAECTDCAGTGFVTPCADCDGTGEYLYEADDFHTCGACNGSGVFPRGNDPCELCAGTGNENWKTPVQIGENWVSLAYLERIEKLPALRVAWRPFFEGKPADTTSTNQILFFEFEGGQGLLMPMRAPRWAR